LFWKKTNLRVMETRHGARQSEWLYPLKKDRSALIAQPRCIVQIATINDVPMSRAFSSKFTFGGGYLDTKIAYLKSRLAELL